MATKNTTPAAAPKTKRQMAPRTLLTNKQKFALMKLIETEYTTSGKTDAEFADYATAQLKDTLAGVSLKRDQVKLLRTDLGVEQNKGSDEAELKAQVAFLTTRVQYLEGLLSKHDITFIAAETTETETEDETGDADAELDDLNT